MNKATLKLAPSDAAEVYFNQSGGITIQHYEADPYAEPILLLLNAAAARAIGSALMAMADELDAQAEVKEPN